MNDAHRVDRDGGFSLIEMMTVVLILGILVSVAIASYMITEETSRRVACLSNQRILRSAVLQFQVENQGLFPDTIEAVRDEVRWDHGFGRCTSVDTSLTYDSLTGEVACPTPGHESR